MIRDAWKSTCSRMEAREAAEKKHCGPEHSKHDDSLQAWHLPASGTPEGPSYRTQFKPQMKFLYNSRCSGYERQPKKELGETKHRAYPAIAQFQGMQSGCCRIVIEAPFSAPIARKAYEDLTCNACRPAYQHCSQTAPLIAGVLQEFLLSRLHVFIGYPQWIKACQTVLLGFKGAAIQA